MNEFPEDQPRTGQGSADPLVPVEVDVNGSPTRNDFESCRIALAIVVFVLA